MEIKAVIFDFNGTLFWDSDYHKEAFDIFIGKYSKEGSDPKCIRITDKQMEENIMGRTNIAIMDFLFQKHLPEEVCKELSLEKELIYQDLCRGKVVFAPGAEEFLGELKKAGIPFMIASSVGKKNLDFYYEQMDLGKWFPRDMVIYNNGTFKSKPDPEIFLMACERLKVKPENACIIEDSESGLTASSRAGAGLTVAVRSPWSAAAKGDIPYKVIDDFRELIPIIIPS